MRRLNNSAMTINPQSCCVVDKVLTHLKVIFLAPEQLRDDVHKCVGRVPARERRLTQVRVHNVLHTPGVRIAISERGELSPNRAPVRPFSCTRARYDAFACCLESLEMFRGNEAGHDHESLFIVLLLERKGHRGMEDTCDNASLICVLRLGAADQVQPI